MLGSARRRFTVASMIDAASSGLWIPLMLLYLVHARGFELTEAGAALSAGVLVGVAAGPIAGMVMDRVSAVALLVASNVVRMVSFAGLIGLSSAWQIIAVAVGISVGDRLFWTANAPYVHHICEGRAAERLLGNQSMARFGGFGVGAAVTALLPDTADAAAYLWVLVPVVVGFGVAAVLMVGLESPLRSAAEEPGRWSTVLADRSYLLLCATQLLFALGSISKFAILPILALDVLGTGQWVPGTAMIVGTVTIVALQRPVLALTSRWLRTTGMLVGAAIFVVSFAAFALLTALPVGAATVVILVASVTLAVAEAVLGPLAIAMAAAAAPRNAQGRASAFFQLSWGVASAVGPALLTWLLSVGNAVLWLTVTGVCALAGLATLRLRLLLPAEALGAASHTPSVVGEPVGERLRS